MRVGFGFTKVWMYRDRLKGMQILLSRTQAGPARTVKEQQEQTSRNHVQRILLISVGHSGHFLQILQDDGGMGASLIAKGT